MSAHLLDRFRNNSLLGAFLAGMDEANRRHFWIDNVNRAAIGHVNAERDPFLIRDQSVTPGEFFIASDGLIDRRNFVAVNLLGGKQRPISHSDLASQLAMSGVEPLECFGFIMRNIDPSSTFDKCVTTNAGCG